MPRPSVKPDRPHVRRVQPATIAIAVLASLLLEVTVAIDLNPPEDGVMRAVWIVTTLTLTAALAVLLVRQVAARSHLDRALARATTGLRELSGPGEGALGERSVPELLDELADQLRSVLGGAWVVVSLTDESGLLRVVTTSGEAPYGMGEERDGATVPNVTSGAVIAAPLAVGDGQLGVVEAAAPSGSRFGRSDHDLLRILADQLAATVERARAADTERRLRLGSTHARAHLRLLADVSVVLSRALDDPREALVESADIIGTSLADSCAIHLAGETGVMEQVAAVNFDLPAVISSDERARRRPHAGDAFRRVMDSGRSELSFVRSDGAVHGADDTMAVGLRAAGMSSWVVAPIRVRGLSVGTITVATTSRRRGLRPSDQSIVDELANRMAIVIERSLLYQESRQAGLAAQRRASQLAQLIEATIAFKGSLMSKDVLTALVRQAVRVLDAVHARAWLRGEAEDEATEGMHHRDAIRIGSPLVDANGGGIGYLAVERDASRPFDLDDESVLLLLARLGSVALQNAKLYDEVRVREQRLSALFAASPLAILELDVVGNVREENPAARELFGVDDRGAVTLPLALRSFVAGLAVDGHAGGVAEAELSVQVGDEALSLWVSTAPLLREGRTPGGVLMVVTDTTTRKRLEAQLIEAHRYESIAELAGGVAHDFNNLLTIIVGYSDLLLRSDDAPPEVRVEVTAINEAGRLAAVITNQLLMLSRRQVLQPIVVPLTEACEGLVPMLRRLVGERVTIETRLAGQSAIRIDQGQLEQILFNLVLNSRDAMAGQGKVVIETTEVPERNEVALSVSDTGQGMDAETLARCREPFFTTKGSRGIGLGLATVSSIAEQSGGRLEIESERGRGTTITALFPLAQRSAASRVDGWSHGPARVLLVDDDDLIRRYASHVLEEAGYDVVAEAEAETALARLETEEVYDLLVSDVVLPGMNGFELARAAGARRPELARLLMTGFTGADTAGTDLAAVAVLPKPFSVEELLTAVGKALDVVGQGSKR